MLRHATFALVLALPAVPVAAQQPATLTAHTLLVLREEAGSLVIRLKHFNPTR